MQSHDQPSTKLPFTLRVQFAAMMSSLPREVRHLVHVLAVLADSDTGEAWHGQETIARMMGCTPRHVRQLLGVLERANDSGVRLERRARFRTDGRGRTSDAWRLVADAPLPEILSTTNRNTVPPEHRVQPEQGARPTGTPRTTNRNTVPGISVEICRSEQPKRSRAGARGSQPSLIAGEGEPESSDHKLVVACYFECFEQEHGEKPVFGSIEGKAVNTLLVKAKTAEQACEFIKRAFLSFRRKTVTIQQIAKDPSAFHPETPKRGPSVQHAPVDEEYFAELGKGRATPTANVVPMLGVGGAKS